MRINKTILQVICCLLIHNTVITQTPATDPHWQLQWEDTFNFFDNTKWIKAHYCDHGEAQLYLADNVWTSNGNLVIRIDDNWAICPPKGTYQVSTWACGVCVPGIHYYTSGWIETTPNYNTKFGYIEARIKLPFRRGFWSAFWTWRGDGVPTSNETEIDIFEMLAHLPSNTVTTNIHTDYNNPNENYYHEHALSNFDYRDWHTYAVEWSPTRMIWYIDGKPIRTVMNHGIIDFARIIFNIAIPLDCLPNTSNFTDYMYIDYVKVHKLNCGNSIITESIGNGFNFNNYIYNVKKSCIFKNTSIPNNKNISVRATDFIELKENFEIDATLGTSLYLDVNPCGGINLACLDYFTDQTITSNTFVNGCDVLYVQEVDISNAANVELTATEKIIIKPGFRAEAGTNVKISIK